MVDMIHDRMNPEQWLSSVENEMKLVKPQIADELSKASGELDSAPNIYGYRGDAKQTVHAYFDAAVGGCQERRQRG